MILNLRQVDYGFWINNLSHCHFRKPIPYYQTKTLTMSSLLSYYLEKGISPVKYTASTISENLKRRKSLYDMLGMPGLLFRGKKVLEIAAGSGQNSLYIAAQQPSKYVLIEPNPVAQKQIAESYSNFDIPHTRPEIIPVTLESYLSNETFDIVICENWLGSSSHERSLVGVIAERVAPGGIMVLTALSVCGWLSNLIRYALTQKLLLSQPNDYDTQVKVVQQAFAPHLQTISGMTRLHEDWVKDNMVNPHYLDQGLTLEMILEKTTPKRFNVFGASPNFITEWRWFKQLHVDSIHTNENVMECYERWTHNFLDYRRTFCERDARLNQELSEFSNALLEALSESKLKPSTELEQDYFDGLVMLLRPIAHNLDDLELRAAVEEAIDVLTTSVITPERIIAMKNYSSWFGRETLYFSLLRLEC